MSTRERWLDAGLEALADEGAPGIRIDRLARRLGLSKGSFFHHFEGIAAYRTALLARWEGTAVGAIPEGDPAAALGSLAAGIGESLDPRLEVGVRAWAFQDYEARAAQERVDTARLAAVEGLWSRILDDPDRARAAALLPHLVVIGATVALPPTSREDLERVFGLLAELIPAV